MHELSWVNAHDVFRAFLADFRHKKNTLRTDGRTYGWTDEWTDWRTFLWRCVQNRNHWTITTTTTQTKQQHWQTTTALTYKISIDKQHQQQQQWTHTFSRSVFDGHFKQSNIKSAGFFFAINAISEFRKLQGAPEYRWIRTHDLDSWFLLSHSDVPPLFCFESRPFAAKTVLFISRWRNGHSPFVYLTLYPSFRLTYRTVPVFFERRMDRWIRIVWSEDSSWYKFLRKEINKIPNVLSCAFR